VLSLGPLKHLVLSARVVSSETRPQLLSTESEPPRAEEEPTIVAEAGASTTPLPLVSTAAVEEGEAAMEVTATQAALETPTGASSTGRRGAGFGEDSAPPLSSENRNVMMAPASKPA
jgi:hypothetical protein